MVSETGIQTLTNKTLTTPVIAQINDANGNEEIIFTATGSAVNELTIANAATGNAPSIATTGGDTNIALTIAPKGSGDVNIDADTLRVGDSNVDATITTNGTGDLTLSTNAGSNSGTVKIFDAANGNIELLPNGTGVVKLDGISYPTADGSANQALVTNGSAVLSFATVSDNFSTKLLHVRDEKPAGTAAGAFTMGAFRTRTLNTVMTNEISGASLASNQITLPSGTYYIDANAPATNVNSHKSKLRNITDSSDTIIGTTEMALDPGSVCTRSIVAGRFTITAQKVFSVQHRCTVDGQFGTLADVGVVEVYAEAMIWKVA
jgi:hypothetical protein